ALLAFGEKFVELVFECLLRDGRLIVGARRGPHFGEHVVAGAVWIGVSAVVVDVTGARAVEAVRKHVAGVGRVALLAAAARTLVTAVADAVLGAIDRVAKIG